MTPRKVRPNRRSDDRRGWLECILIGLIVAAFIAGASFAGQLIDQFFIT